jgi:hypothetical protein
VTLNPWRIWWPNTSVTSCRRPFSSSGPHRSTARLYSASASPVQVGEELPVGGPGGLEFLIAFLGLVLQLDDLLLHLGDLTLQLINVGRGAQARLSPDLLPEQLGQCLLQLPDAGGIVGRRFDSDSADVSRISSQSEQVGAASVRVRAVAAITASIRSRAAVIAVICSWRRSRSWARCSSMAVLARPV